MNSMQVKDKLKRISKEKNVDFNTLLRLYMYDRFIERLSLSEYKDNFILKGGFYLSTIYGTRNRTTMDIDTALRNSDFTESNIISMIEEITKIDIGDNVKLSISNIAPIRDEDEYGGFRISMLVELENIKEKFHIDIATGDPITPSAISYKYNPVLGDEKINIWAYNIETVLSEKIETVLNRAELNGRMKDFYDIYLIYTKDWSNVNKNHFRSAAERTFEKRGFTLSKDEMLSTLRESLILRKRWDSYTKKYDYARNIEFDEVLNCLENILDVLEPVNV